MSSNSHQADNRRTALRLAVVGLLAVIGAWIQLGYTSVDYTTLHQAFEWREVDPLLAWRVVLDSGRSGLDYLFVRLAGRLSWDWYALLVTPPLASLVAGTWLCLARRGTRAPHEKGATPRGRPETTTSTAA